MNLHARLGILVHQRADAPRLRSRKILADHAAGREVNRKFLVHRIAAFPVGRRHETEFAVAMERLQVLEQSRRSGMFQRWARPEHAQLTVNFFVSDAVVIRVAAARGLAQLVKNGARAFVIEKSLLSEPPGQVAINCPVRARVARRINHLLDVQHAALDIRHHAFVLLLQAAGQHHVRVMRGFGKEEIHHAEKLELLQRLASEIRVRQRHERIEADREQGLDFTAVDRVHDFLRGQAGWRNFLR